MSMDSDMVGLFAIELGIYIKFHWEGFSSICSFQTVLGFSHETQKSSHNPTEKEEYVYIKAVDVMYSCISVSWIYFP